MSAIDCRLDPEDREVRRLEVITGALGRRRWSTDAKAPIVAESWRRERWSWKWRAGTICGRSSRLVNRHPASQINQLMHLGLTLTESLDNSA
jgi:hypothetical protein